MTALFQSNLHGQAFNTVGMIQPFYAKEIIIQALP